MPFFGLDLCFDAEWPEDTWTVREVIYVVRDSYFLVYAVDDELDFEHDGARTPAEIRDIMLCFADDGWTIDTEDDDAGLDLDRWKSLVSAL